MFMESLLSSEYKEFKRASEICEQVHKRNSHKLSCAINL